MNLGSVLIAADPSLCPGTQAPAKAAFLPVPFSPTWDLSCTLQISWAEDSCSVVYDHLTQRHSRSLCKPGPIPSPESIIGRPWFWSIQVSKSFVKTFKHLRYPSLDQSLAYYITCSALLPDTQTKGTCSVLPELPRPLTLLTHVPDPYPHFLLCYASRVLKTSANALTPTTVLHTPYIFAGKSPSLVV